MQTEKTRHLRTRVISVLLAVLMIVTCLPSMLFPVSADSNGRSGGPLVLTNASVEFRDSKYNPIDEVNTGDVFYLKTLGEILEYQIDQIVTVLPSEVDGLSIEPGKDYVTLVTCTPYGINSHRLLIRGTRIPYDEKYAEKVPLKPAPAVSDRPAEEQGRKLGTRQWILFAIAAFGVAILLGILAPSGKKKGKASSKTEETADQRNKELSQNSKAEKKEGSHEKNEEEK